MFMTPKNIDYYGNVRIRAHVRSGGSCCVPQKEYHIIFQLSDHKIKIFFREKLSDDQKGRIQALKLIGKSRLVTDLKYMTRAMNILKQIDD